MICPVNSDHGDFSKESLGMHIAGAHPELTQGSIKPIPTVNEVSTVTDVGGVTKVTQNLDKLDSSKLNPIIDLNTIVSRVIANKDGSDARVLQPPLTKEPIVLQYKYNGTCGKCNQPVRTLILEIGSPKETHAVAICDEHGQLEERKVAKL